jgi:outer membrane receptor protein involved in Fe transport
VDRAIRWDANYTYYGFSIDQAAFYPGDTLLPNTPRHAANLSASWTGVRGARVRAGWRWEDAHRWHAGVWQGFVPSSGSVDLHASLPFRDHFTASLSVTDLLDQKRYHLFGGSVVGRRALAGFTWRR